MKKVFTLLIALLLATASSWAQTTTFETFTPGTVNYQGTGTTADVNGYTIPSPYGSLWTTADEWGFQKPTPNFDQEVKDDGSGNKVWRISNAVTSSSYSWQPNSPSSTQPAGETTAALWNDRGTNHTTPLSPPLARAIAATKYFHGGFKFKSATGATQTGLAHYINAGPRQTSFRMSQIAIIDGGTGFNLTFSETTAGPTVGFPSTTIASNLSYSDWHQLDIYIQFEDGLNGDGSGNDVVTVMLNGAEIYTGTTWETYFNSIASTTSPSPIAVDALFIRAAGTAAPATSGFGLYFDDVTVNNAQVPGPVNVYTDNTLTTLVSNHATIQEAINAAVDGNAVQVADGTYNENVTINKNITLISVNGASSTIIDGNNAGAELGTVYLLSGRNEVTIGAVGQGFTIKGIDGTPGLEKAAVYLQGAQDNITIEGNIIEARGDHGLLGEYNAAQNHITINNNEFSGQTFIGANPAGVGFSAQFSLPNVPRQLVVFGGGTGTTNTQNFTFTNNLMSGIAGGMSITDNSGNAIAPTEQGNTLVTLDLVGTNVITGNTFSGTTARYAEALRARGNGTYTITENNFTGTYPGYINSNSNPITATCNWFGTTDASVIASKIDPSITYIPFNISEGGACIGGLTIATTIETPTSSPCGTLDVPVTVQDFNAVANVSLVLNYDAAVLVYQSVDINGALTGAFSNAFTSGALGTFILGRNSASDEITLAGNPVLFTLHFNILPAAVGGSTTDLTWDTSDPGNNEYSSGGATPTIYSSTFADLTGIVIPEWLVRNITQGTNYCKIQDAIDDSNPLGGDVIEALAATYTENLTIDKSLTLLGSNAIKSPNTETRVTEAIIQPPVVGVHAMVGAATNITVTMKGFTVDMVNAGTDERFFDQVGKSGTTWTFENNIFKNAKVCGTGNWRLTGNNAGLVFNLIDNHFTNNAVSNGIAIWDAPFTANIRDNVWKDNGGWAMNLNQVSGIIENNTFIDTDPIAPDNVWSNNQNGFIIAAANNDVEIINNSFINNYSSINIYENTEGVLDISGNFFENNITYAIKIRALANPGLLTFGAHINSFTGVASGGFAIINQTAGFVSDATCNWFGTNVPSAFALLLDGDVDAVPFLIDGIDLEPGTPGFQPTVGCDELAPTVTGPMDELTVSGCSVADAPAAVTTVAALEAMGAVIADNATANGDLVVTSSDVSAGTCPIVITRTYTITDESGNASNIVQIITITHLTIPAEVGGPAPTASTVECQGDATAPTTLPTVQDMCGNVLTTGTPEKQLSFTNTFDEAVTLSATEADDVWYTDRYAPAGFVAQESFDGGMRLKHSISAADGASSRPSSYSSAFYNTQGRKYNPGVATDEISIKLYIPTGWATTNKRMAGIWGTALDASEVISAYPIVEFTSDGNNPRFRVYETATGSWINVGLPSGFAYDSWITLKIRVLPEGGILYTVGSMNYVDNSTTSERIDNVILQGHNYDPDVIGGGVTYDIYWDDFTWNDEYTALDCEGQIAYTYIFEDCAGSAFAWTYTYTVERITAPLQVGTPVSNSSTVYSIDDATEPLVSELPVVEDVCGNVLSPTLASPVMLDNITGCTGTRTYTYTYVDCTELIYVWTYTYTLSTSTINGTLVYNNSVKTPMNLVKLIIKNDVGDQVGSEVPTSGSGAFVFPDLCAGIYTIHVTYNIKDLGGINSTDAGAVNAWSVTYGTDPIEHVKFLAGDVIANKQLASDDALKIQRYFVFHEAFPAATPNWVYWKAGEIINHNEDPYATEASWPTEITVEVNGNIPNLELYGMATGDFNGSLVPTLLKSASPSLVLSENSNLQIGANQEFELPMRAASAMEVSAVSMILELPANMVQVQDVVVNGSEAPVMWAVKGNELRIGWNSLSPVNVAENGSLLTLKLKTSAAFAPGQSLAIELPFDPLNELADGNHLAVENAALMVAKVGNATVSATTIAQENGLLLSNYPNPFSKFTTLEYTLPVDGRVTINLYNNLGQLVTTIVEASQNAGQYSFRYESDALQPGIYVAKLRLSNSETDMVGIIKLSVQK